MQEITEQHENIFRTPQIFQFPGFCYFVGADLKERMKSLYLRQAIPQHMFPKFDPKFAIDDYLNWFAESRDNELFKKSYNFDPFGIVFIEYSSRTGSVWYTKDFVIRLSYPARFFEQQEVMALLKYAIHDNYVRLARELSVYEMQEPFGRIFVYLDSHLDATRAANNSLRLDFDAGIYEGFSQHFCPSPTNQTLFIACQPLPFPVVEIPENVNAPVEPVPWDFMPVDNMPRDVPVVVIPPLPTAMDVPPNMGSDDESSDEDADIIDIWSA